MTLRPSEIYRERYPTLQQIAGSLEGFLVRILEDLPRIDRVTARAKSPERFRGKAEKVLEDGAPKYADPLSQIQDQIAARVIVFYENDVETVTARLEPYLRAIEKKDHVPDSYWKFGYFGRHWIFALPGDVISMDIDMTKVPRFFELQVKTLFQHAWSEANHDLAYKAIALLTPDQERRVAFSAAQAWGADHVFKQLVSELGVAGTVST